MPALRRASRERLRAAQLLREQYTLVADAQPSVAESVPVELEVTVRNPWLDRIAIAFEIDGVFAGEEPFVPRGENVGLGSLAAIAGPRQLGVNLQTPRTFFYFSGPVSIPAAPADVLIDVWNALYPPRVVLDGTWINRPPGLRYRGPESPPCPGSGDCALYLIDRDQPPWDLGSVDPQALLDQLDLWIDGNRIAAFDPLRLAYVVPVMHRALLSPGLHHVRIGDPRRRMLILDSDILLEPAHGLRVEITDRSAIVIDDGESVLLRVDARERPFRQGEVLADELPDPKRQVDGIPIPPGAEGYIDEIEEEIAYLRAMAANFQEFRNKKEAVNRKKTQGLPLTPDEQAIDAIDTYEKLQKWGIAKKKVEHGWDLEPEAGTDPEGKKTFLGKPPTDPMQELSKRETMDIHEESHVQDADVLALFYGIDLAKLRRRSELFRQRLDAIVKWIAAAKKAKDEGTPPPPPLDWSTPEEQALDQWYEANKKKIEEYYDAFRDPLWGAKGEIREYLAGADFFEGVLQYLKAKSYGWVVTDMSLDILIGETKPIIVEQTPNAPPRVRVIEGDAHVEVSPTQRTSSSPLYGGFRIDVKGRTKGRVRIELTCGTLKKVIVVNVV